MRTLGASAVYKVDVAFHLQKLASKIVIAADSLVNVYMDDEMLHKNKFTPLAVRGVNPPILGVDSDTGVL